MLACMSLLVGEMSALEYVLERGKLSIGEFKNFAT